LIYFMARRNAAYASNMFLTHKETYAFNTLHNLKKPRNDIYYKDLGIGRLLSNCKVKQMPEFSGEQSNLGTLLGTLLDGIPGVKIWFVTMCNFAIQCKNKMPHRGYKSISHGRMQNYQHIGWKTHMDMAERKPLKFRAGSKTLGHGNKSCKQQLAELHGATSSFPAILLGGRGSSVGWMEDIGMEMEMVMGAA